MFDKQVRSKKWEELGVHVAEAKVLDCGFEMSSNSGCMIAFNFGLIQIEKVYILIFF